MTIHIIGTGLYAPAEVLTSEALERRLGLEPGWIERRAGIRERRIAGPAEAVSDLAVAAGEAALRTSGVDPRRVSLLVLATSTPDHPLPPTAPLVATRLGMAAPAFDLAAACTGFLYGYALAARWLAAPDALTGGAPAGAADAAAAADAATPVEPPLTAGMSASARDPAGIGAGIESGRDAALVIAANVLSRRVNWDDPATAALFGDGAGAVVLRRDAGVAGGVLGIDLHADGTHWRDVWIPAGGSRCPTTHQALDTGATLMRMERGGALFRRAVRMLADSSERALRRAGLGSRDVTWFVPHQGGSRLMEEAASTLGIPCDRVISAVARYGNTSAAGIPMALHEAAADGRIRPGDVVLLAAVGSGMTAGALVVRM